MIEEVKIPLVGCAICGCESGNDPVRPMLSIKGASFNIIMCPNCSLTLLKDIKIYWAKIYGKGESQ